MVEAHEGKKKDSNGKSSNMIKQKLGASCLYANMIHYLKHILRTQAVMGRGGEATQTIKTTDVLNCQSQVTLRRRTKLGKRFQMKL